MKKRLLVAVSSLILLSLLAGCASLQSLSGGGKSPKESPTTSAGSSGNPFFNNIKPSASPSVKPSPSATASPSVSASPSAAASASAKLPVVSNTQFEYNSMYIETRVTLPQVSGLDSAVQSKINAVFNDFMAAAKKDSTTYEAESKQTAQEAGTSGEPYMIRINYTVPYNSNGILCLLISDYRYLGGAHGGVARTSYIFDTKTGRTLTLGDLMQTGSAYKKTINSFIRKEIDKRTATEDLIEITTFEDIGDSPAFYLTSEAIVFYFQEYEYFPYAAGIQEFALTYDSLSGLLKKEYAVLKIAPTVLKPDVKNSLAAGGIGRISLDGNPTTGYSWKFKFDEIGIIEMASWRYSSDAQPGIVGAGGRYTWDFRALKPGTATIVFTYSRDWETDTTEQEKTVRLTVTVK